MATGATRAPTVAPAGAGRILRIFRLPAPSDAAIRWGAVLAMTAAVAVSHWIPAAHADFPSVAPPLFLSWSPVISPVFGVPLALGALLVLAVPALLRMPRVAFLLAVMAFVFAASVALAAQDLAPRETCCSRDGVAAVLAAPINRPTDYLHNVGMVRLYGPREFARAYPWLARPAKHRLSLRAMTHPPGAVLLAWSLDGAAHDDGAVVALLIVMIGSLAVVPAYLLGRELHDEHTGRVAALLFATCPIVLLYTATAFDAAFMTVGAFAMAALAAAPRRTLWAVAGGALAAPAVTLTYGLFALLPIAAGLFLIALRTVRPRAVLARGAAALGSFVVTILLLQWIAGIHLPAAFATAQRVQHDLADVRMRSFGYWTFGGNVVAFLVAAGLGLSSLFVLQTVRAWRRRRPGLETILWVAMIGSSLMGVLRGETEHLWMFFVPMLAAAAAPAIASARARAEMGAGLLQAGATQVLFWTNW
jgi:methylthioxylose transferase